MNVFVTGASGYIGRAAAVAMRRAGHDVFGLVRSAEKGRALSLEEVHPVVGDVNEPSTYEGVAESCSVLVHAASDAKAGVVGPDRTVIDTFERLSGRGARPKTFLYTSGVWVYGDTGSGIADESTPLQPAELVAWRPPHERRVLESRALAGIVLRPGCVYGKAGGMTGLWFAPAAKGQKPQVVGDGRNRWATIHIDDLADAYVRAAELGRGGEVFNLTDRSRATVGEMAAAAARAAGGTGDLDLVPAGDAARDLGVFAHCLALNQHVDSRKAVRLLGWQPRHGGFLDEVGQCFEAWHAHAG